MECPSCHATISGSLTRCPACKRELPEPVKTLVHEKEFELLDGKWLLEQKLGQGGMGTVYLARDLELGRRVAIKMMSPSYADNAELVARFEREAQIMARLDHPHIVSVYAVGRRERSPFIVMKYLEGASLADYLREKGPLPLGEVLSICQQICSGLQFIHDQGVVHRDIKPANLFIGPSGHVTLLDLGVARDTQNAMTHSGVVVGTPRYMAPEQVLGRHVDYRADLYALGTVLFEMLTGTPVFVGSSDYSIMKAHVDEPPPDPTTLADIPSALTPVLFRALEKRPADRFQSADELLEAFTRAVGPEVVPQRARPGPAGAGGADQGPPARETREAPPSPPSVLPTVPPSAIPDPPPPVEAWSSAPLPREQPAAATPRRWPRAIAAGLVIAAAGATALLQPWRREDAPTRAAPPAEGRGAARAPSAAVASAPAPRPEKPSGAVPTTRAAAAAVPEAPPVPLPGPAPEVATPPAGGERGASGVPSRRAIPRPAPVPAPAELRLIVTTRGGLSWAFVDLDGLRQGSTPMTVRVEPGTHRLVFMREGFERVSREVTVGSGEKRKLSVELTATGK